MPEAVHEPISPDVWEILSDPDAQEFRASAAEALLLEEREVGARAQAEALKWKMEAHRLQYVALQKRILALNARLQIKSSDEIRIVEGKLCIRRTQKES